jgi:serine acetyltransferase
MIENKISNRTYIRAGAIILGTVKVGDDMVIGAILL